MPHIDLGNDEAGIRSLFMYRPETAYPMRMLAEVLLRGPSTLARGERELIATYVSSRNGCSFCTASHAACASVQLPQGMALTDQVRADPETASVTPKLAALLRIAGARAGERAGGARRGRGDRAGSGRDGPGDR